MKYNWTHLNSAVLKGLPGGLIVWHTHKNILENLYFLIFTFNKHFDKENDCVYEPVITKPHHWRRLFITFYMNFLLFKNENSTYLMK